jgi:hypothetical protein
MQGKRVTGAVGYHWRLAITHVHWHTMARAVTQYAVLKDRRHHRTCSCRSPFHRALEVNSKDKPPASSIRVDIEVNRSAAMHDKNEIVQLFAEKK